MRVLVTGGSGFVGSHVVDELLARGMTPVIFDLEPSRYHPADEVEAVTECITDAAALRGAMPGCDAVIHLAAVADVNHVADDPDRARHVNGTGTRLVVEAAAVAGVRRVVYGSTVWVYGDCVEEAVDETTPILAPSHLYTQTKLAGEEHCREIAEEQGIEWTILRFGIPYGPRARDATVLSAFVARAEAGEPLTIAGDGLQFRPFVYVEDLAQGIVSALRPVAANRTYNLASSRTVTIREVGETVTQTVRDVPIVFGPSRPDDFSGKAISSARARSELGWHATTSFVEGTRRYLAWRRVTPRRRVLVLSADIGEGHDGPARAIAAGLVGDEPGTEVSIRDGLAAMGWILTAIVRDGSWLAFNWLPLLFEAQYALFARFAPTRRLATRLLYLLGARRLRKLVRGERPDVVVSTYPGTTAVLGELRLRGKLDVPIVSAITDLAGLRYWAHPGVDLHTVIHQESIAEVERMAGEGSARWARAPTARGFFTPRAAVDARRALGLDPEGRIVIVSGGGWGIGDLRGATEAALEAGATQVVGLCGHSHRARRRLERAFAGDPRVRVIGFTDQMSDLLAAADVLVHSTAGLTVLEAQMRGTRVVSYGFGAGHIRLNNRAYRRFGLARTARGRPALRRCVREALAEARRPDGSFADLPSVASLALAARRRVSRIPAWRLRLARGATGLATTAAILAWGLSTDDAYPLVAKAFDLHPTTRVATTQPRVGLLIDASSSQMARVARALHRQGERASFATVDRIDPATLATVRSLGEDAMPQLTTGSLVHWLKTKSYLRDSAEQLGLDSRFLYALPPSGFTLGQYALAHAAGGRPVTGAVRLDGESSIPTMSAGEVVEVGPGDRAAQLVRAVDAVAAQLRAAGLHGVSVDRLLGVGVPGDGTGSA